MNRELIYQAYQNIKASPETFSMMGWGRNGCGTVACFAGHVTLIDGSGYYEDKVLCNVKPGLRYFDSQLVVNTLGLKSTYLFHVTYWPEHITQVYCTHPIKALRQAIVYFTQYDPEFAPEQGDSLPTEEVVLSVSLTT